MNGRGRTRDGAGHGGIGEVADRAQREPGKGARTDRLWGPARPPEEQAELLLENVDGALASAHELLATLRGAITTRDFEQAMRLRRLLRHRLDAIDSLCQQDRRGAKLGPVASRCDPGRACGLGLAAHRIGASAGADARARYRIRRRRRVDGVRSRR
jgi:hypothetical protein